jgi:hypothetical protein
LLKDKLKLKKHFLKTYFSYKNNIILVNS